MTAGADLCVYPGLGLQEPTGADTQVCPCDDLQISLKSRAFSNWFHPVSASYLSRPRAPNSYLIARN